MGKMDPGVNVYSRKVLIQAKSKQLLSDWLRFVKGAVDSEDIPLNLSREHLQDSTLVKKVGSVITKKILKFLEDESKTEREKYEKFFKEFGSYLKEGIISDFRWKDDIAKLILSESSAFPQGKLSSFEEYVTRMKPDQKEIYYLVIPNRAYAEASPYYETFKKRDIEVLFFYTGLDDFVVSNLNEFAGKKLVSIESAALPEDKESKKDENSLKEEEIKELTNWMKEVLSDKVLLIKPTTRLTSTPAIIVDHESANFRRMMKFVDPSRAPTLPKQNLEINPSHPIIMKLNTSRKDNPEFSKLIAEQIYDDALIAAGLMDDARSMLARLNKILEHSVSK